MQPYQIAIPTHRRPSEATLRLKYLEASGVDLSRVTLFLSDEEDLRLYDTKALRRVPRNVDPSSTSLTNKVNVIHRFYALGTNVVVLEDDVELVEPSVACGKNGVRVLNDFDAVVRAGFDSIPDGGLWGIAPHANAFYFTGKVTRTLKLVVAHCFGFVSTHLPRLEVTQPTKTDYERTLRYFVHYGEVLRLDMVGVRTVSYTAPGGLQADHTTSARAALEQAACVALVQRWPHLVEHKAKSTSPFAELRFKRWSGTHDELCGLQSALDRQSKVSM